MFFSWSTPHCSRHNHKNKIVFVLLPFSTTPLVLREPVCVFEPALIQAQIVFRSISKVAFDAGDKTALRAAIVNDLVALVPGLTVPDVTLGSMVTLRGQTTLKVPFTLRTRALTVRDLLSQAVDTAWTASITAADAFRCTDCGAPTVCSPECEDDGSSVAVGAIVGGVIAGLVALGLIGVGVFLYKKHQAKKDDERRKAAAAAATASIASPSNPPPYPTSQMTQGGYPMQTSHQTSHQTNHQQFAPYRTRWAGQP